MRTDRKCLWWSWGEIEYHRTQLHFSQKSPQHFFPVAFLQNSYAVLYCVKWYLDIVAGNSRKSKSRKLDSAEICPFERLISLSGVSILVLVEKESLSLPLFSYWFYLFVCWSIFLSALTSLVIWRLDDKKRHLAKWN